MISNVTPGLYRTNSRWHAWNTVANVATPATSAAANSYSLNCRLKSLTVLMMLSGLLVALAPNALGFMAGRAVVGILIGGSPPPRLSASGRG